MRHYVAVQDEHGRWFYANEGRSRQTGEYGWAASGACWPHEACPTCDPYGFRGPAIGSEGCETCDGKGVIDKTDPCKGHDSAEEAYAHQKAHLLATSVRFDDDHANARQLHRCEAEGCSQYTSGGARCGGYKHWSLCAEHRTKEVVTPLLHVGESWES